MHLPAREPADPPLDRCRGRLELPAPQLAAHRVQRVERDLPTMHIKASHDRSGRDPERERRAQHRLGSVTPDRSHTVIHGRYLQLRMSGGRGLQPRTPSTNVVRHGGPTTCRRPHRTPRTWLLMSSLRGRARRVIGAEARTAPSLSSAASAFAELRFGDDPGPSYQSARSASVPAPPRLEHSAANQSMPMHRCPSRTDLRLPSPSLQPPRLSALNFATATQGSSGAPVPARVLRHECTRMASAARSGNGERTRRWPTATARESGWPLPRFSAILHASAPALVSASSGADAPARGGLLATIGGRRSVRQYGLSIRPACGVEEAGPSAQFAG